MPKRLILGDLLTLRAAAFSEHCFSLILYLFSPFFWVVTANFEALLVCALDDFHQAVYNFVHPITRLLNCNASIVASSLSANINSIKLYVTA